MPIRDEAINVFMGLPGDGARLELTYNHGVDSYELGTGYNHIAVTVDGPRRHARPARREGHRARETALHACARAGRGSCFVRDPDGYRIELIEKLLGVRAPDSRSSTSGRTRSGWWSSPRYTGHVVEAHGRDPRGRARGRGPRTRTGELQPEPMERALETLELYAHFCPPRGSRTCAPVATSAIRDAAQPGASSSQARDGALAGWRSGARAGEEEARYGYLAAVNSTTLRRRRRARPGRRLDAARRASRTARRPTRARGRWAPCA